MTNSHVTAASSNYGNYDRRKLVDIDFDLL